MSSYEDDLPVFSDSAVEKVQRLAREMGDAERAVKDAEGDVKAAKERFADYRDRRMPDALDEMGVGEDGISIPGVGIVVAKDDIVGSLPDDPAERTAAIAILDSLGHGDVVKRTIVITLGRDSTPQADRIVRSLQKFDLELAQESQAALTAWQDKADELQAGGMSKRAAVDAAGPKPPVYVPMIIEHKLDVHPQTLCKLGREMLADGSEFPFKQLGLTAVRRAAIRKKR